MPLSNNELARRENGRLDLRESPIRILWSFDDLLTQDGHRLQATFTASARALSESSERKMLEEVFFSRNPALTTDAVLDHFQPTLRAAAARAARLHPASAWIDGSQNPVMIEALRAAAVATAFSAGLDITGPFVVTFDSLTYQSQQLETLQRTLAERRVAGQVEHFERASKLLKQFQALKDAAPDLAPADILRQVSPADQGLMLQTLLLAAGKSSAPQSLWAVAGTSLVRIDPRATPVTMEMVEVPADLGPLRSVQAAHLDGKPVLLIGAKGGVILYDPATFATVPYADHSIDSPLGFSSAVLWNRQLWGVHGDAGVVAWNLGSPDAPVQAIRPVELRGADNPPPIPAPGPTGTTRSISTRTAGIRNLLPLDEARLVFSVGHVITVISTNGSRRAVSLDGDCEIISLLPDIDRLIVVRENGVVALHDRVTLAQLAQGRRTGRVTAAALLPWLGSSRILLATDEGPVYCVGPDDELVTTYLSSHRGLRATSAAVDLVAAVSSDRQRLVLWNAWDGKKPSAELNIAANTRHRVGDIEFA